MRLTTDKELVTAYQKRLRILEKKGSSRFVEKII
jgi:hypothetical protein